jgi:hypothetical protein
MKYYQSLQDVCVKAARVSKAYNGEAIVMQHFSSKLYYIKSYTADAEPNDELVCKYICGELIDGSPNIINMCSVKNVLHPGDKPEPEISMPVGKNELMLLGLALREYRYSLSKNHRDAPNHAYVVLMQQLTALEQKVISNEISWDTLYGGNPDNKG